MTKTGKKCCDGAFAKALAGASVQVELALKESYAPVEFLGETIGQLSRLLNESASEDADAAGRNAAKHVVVGDEQLAELKERMKQCIEKLQFHDRMAQHLTHVRDYLAAIAIQLDDTDEFRETYVAPSGGDWDTLRQRLRERLTSGAQRELFDLILASESAAESAKHKNEHYSAQGSVELF